MFYIVCLCGYPIDDVSEIYLSMVDDLKREKLSKTTTKVENFDIDPEIDIQLGAILDSLGVKKICCRKVLMCAEQMIDTF